MTFKEYLAYKNPERRAGYVPGKEGMPLRLEDSTTPRMGTISEFLANRVEPSAGTQRADRASSSSKPGLGKTLLDELLLKPVMGYPTSLAYDWGALPRPASGEVNLPFVSTPYKLPDTALQRTGAAADFALTAAMFIPGGQLIGGGGRVAKGAKVALELEKAAAAQRAATVAKSARLAGETQKAAQVARVAETAAATAKAAEELKAGQASIFDKALPNLTEAEKAARDAAAEARRLANAKLGGPKQVSIFDKAKPVVSQAQTQAAELPAQAAERVRLLALADEEATTAMKLKYGQGYPPANFTDADLNTMLRARAIFLRKQNTAAAKEVLAETYARHAKELGAMPAEAAKAATSALSPEEFAAKTRKAQMAKDAAKLEQEAKDLATAAAKTGTPKALPLVPKPKVASNFSKNLLEQTALGAGFGAAKSAQEEDSTLAGTAQGALLGAAGGAAFTGLGALAGKAVGGLIDNPLTRKLANNSFVKRGLSSSENVLERMGPGGKLLAKAFRESRNTYEQRSAELFRPIQETWTKLPAEAQRLLVNYIESGNWGKQFDNIPVVPGVNPEDMINAMGAWKNVSSIIADEAIAAGLLTKQGLIEHYFPLVGDSSKFDDSGVKKILQHLVDTKQANNLSDASEKWRQYISEYAQGRAGNLEYSRQKVRLPDEFYIQDPVQRMFKYVNDSQKRFANITYFGKKNEKLQSYLSAVINTSTPEDSQLAEVIVRQLREQNPLMEPQIYKTARTLQQFSLGLASISNMFQGINSVTVMGMRNAIPAYVESMTQLGRKFAIDSGAVAEGAFRDLTSELNQGALAKGAKLMFKHTQFNRTEEFNRVFTANLAKRFAREMEARLSLNPADDFARRKLADLGLSADDILAKPFAEDRLVQGISGEELRVDPRLMKAAQNAANKYQFRAGAQDLPLLWSTPGGKVITQFKSFAFKQAQFITDQVFKEVAAGNMRPLLRYVALGNTLGWASDSIKSSVRGDVTKLDDKRKSELKNFVYNMSAVGGFGLGSDALLSAGSGRFSLMATLLGPTVGDITDVATSTAQAVLPREMTGLGQDTSRLRGLGKFGTSQIPVFGPMFRQKIFNPEAGPKDPFASSIKDTKPQEFFNFKDE